jgi:hypothetical protein
MCCTRTRGLRSREIGGSCRRSGIPRRSGAENSSPPEDSFTLEDAIALTAAGCALPDAGIWPALAAVDVKFDHHAAAIHETAVLRSVRRV